MKQAGPAEFRAREIQSRSNAHFKQLKLWLSHARKRDTDQRIIIEGWHLAQAARAQGFKVLETYLSQTSWREQADEIQKLGLKQDDSVYVLDDLLFRDLSQLAQGSSVIQVLAQRSVPLIMNASEPMADCAVLLDGIQDPGNLGTLIRSAAAAGVSQVLLSQGCADPWSLKALRAGMGAQFSVNLHTDADISSVVSEWQGAVLGTALQARENLYETELKRANLWCFGSEGGGLSPACVRSILDHPAGRLIRIDQSAAVESLNVAAAAAICLFEQRRRLTS